MKVRIGKSLEIDKKHRNDIIAYAGHVGSYKPGMSFREVVQALAEESGVGFLQKMLDHYANPSNDRR